MPVIDDASRLQHLLEAAQKAVSTLKTGNVPTLIVMNYWDWG